MRVLLIEPKYGYREALTWIPIGKGYLATQARNLGHEVRIIDNALRPNTTDEQLSKSIADFAPDIIGTGGMSLQWTDSKRVARIAREVAPEALLVGGGVHLTALPEEGVDIFDLVAVGEGEHTFRDVVTRRAGVGKSGGRSSYQDIPGLCFKNRLGAITRTPERDFVVDMDSLGWPSYDLMEVPLYHDHLVMGERGISLMTGRGCCFNCNFCASPFITKRKMRNFSLEFVFDQMQMLERTYGFTNFRIMDDTFAASRPRVKKFCEEMRTRGLRYNFNCLTHVNTSNQEMFEQMVGAGFSVVAFGIESANDGVLKLINKGTTKENAAGALKQARAAGLVPEALFMVGNIGDTRETVEETVEFAKDHNRPFVDGVRKGFNWFQFATPFPGSKFYTSAKDYGTILSHDYDDYSHQFPVFIPHGLDYETMVRLRALGLQGEGVNPHQVQVKSLEWD
jgi:radical SAM superfamily enzyme YgiQ (UPF0313 family)